MDEPLQRLMYKKEILELLGISAVTLWVWMKDGHFPRSIILNPTSRRTQRVAWFEDEVRAWFKERKRSVFVGEEGALPHDPRMGARKKKGRKG